MSPLRARVENGRIVLDEPTTLRDGTVIDLVADDEGDDLTDEERRALHQRYRLLGSPPRLVASGPRPRFWMNCADGGEPSSPNHPRS